VLLALTAAGLLRPEAWGLALVYVAWLWRGLDRRDRVRLLALALAAPLAWFLSDLIITGDPLHSLHGTSDLAEENDRRRDVQDVPYWTVQYFGLILRLPLLIGIPIGLYLAFRRGVTRAAVPFVVAGLLVLAFTALPILGLPLIGRYLRTPAALLAVFYGAACFAWLSLPRGRERTVLALVGVACLAASFAYAPSSYKQLENLEWRTDRQSIFFGSLDELAHSRRVTKAFARCPDLTAADHRPVPHLRFWLDGDPGTVSTIEGDERRPGLIHVVPRPTRVPRNYYKSDYPKSDAPPGYQRIYINRAWRVFTTPECNPKRRRG
jgi:mannose/fructose/N-acetylgalactosamine-specific phosphotransferase system component IIC